MQILYQIVQVLSCYIGLVYTQQCHNKEFAVLRLDRYSPDGPILTADRASQKQCERSCRLTPDCRAYLITWTDETCQLYRNMTLDSHQLQGQQTLYGDPRLCPATMTYSADYGACLRTHTTKMTWYQGRDRCRQLHPQAHLVAITSAQKQRVLDGIADEDFGRGYKDRYFTSAKVKVAGNPTFVWDSSGLDVEFDNWYPGEPNGFRHREVCMEVRYQGTKWQWNDNACRKTWYIICEF